MSPRCLLAYHHPYGLMTICKKYPFITKVLYLSVSLVRIKERNPVLQGSPKERKALPARRRHSKKQLPMGGSPIDESLESGGKEKITNIVNTLSRSSSDHRAMP